MRWMSHVIMINIEMICRDDNDIYRFICRDTDEMMFVRTSGLMIYRDDV